MKKAIFVGWLLLFLPAMIFAQEKVEAPVWNVGDKWVFTGNGNIEVIKADQSGYILKFSEGKCIFESQGCKTILFEKTTLNRMNILDGDKNKKYGEGLSKILDFPLNEGKQWKTGYSSIEPGPLKVPVFYDYSETYRILGWEDITVHAGKFKVLGLEYRRKIIGSPASWSSVGEEIINQYWYSPDVKYFVKCKYDKDWIKAKEKIFDWELTSFQLKK
jgi:hypothetical protein